MEKSRKIHLPSYTVWHVDTYLSEFRTNKRRQTILHNQFFSENIEMESHPAAALPNELSDSLLRMLFNIARLDTRENQAGLVLLEDQDRQSWDQQKIAQALLFLNQSTDADDISRYHIEASITAQHCLAKTYQDTRWDKIIEGYRDLRLVCIDRQCD